MCVCWGGGFCVFKGGMFFVISCMMFVQRRIYILFLAIFELLTVIIYHDQADAITVHRFQFGVPTVGITMSLNGDYRGTCFRVPLGSGFFCSKMFKKS